MLAGNECAPFSVAGESGSGSAQRREYADPQTGLDIGFRVEALSSSAFTGLRAADVFAYFHVVGEGDGGHEDEDEDGDEGGDEDGVEGRAARVSDYLRLEDVFGRVWGS